MAYKALHLLSLAYLFGKIHCIKLGKVSAFFVLWNLGVLPFSTWRAQHLQEASCRPTTLGLVPLLHALKIHGVSLAQVPAIPHGYHLFLFESLTLTPSP